MGRLVKEVDLDRRLIWAFVAVAAAGMLVIWLIGHYNVGAEHLGLAMALGYCIPVVYALLTVWFSRARQDRRQGVARRTWRAGFLWFLAAWVLLGVIAWLRWGESSAKWARTADVFVLVVLGGSLAWVAYRYYGYRFARLTRRRGIVVGLLAVLLAVMLYAAYWSRGGWSQFANFFWFFVVIAIFAVLRKEDVGRRQG